MSTITTIQASDVIGNSRSDINTNFSNLNTDKVEGQAASIDSEVAIFSGTGGKTIKRASSSGIAKLTSGVLSAVTAPSGALVGDTDSQALTNKTIAGGSNTISGITEAMQTLADNTTGDVSTTKHGYAPKAPNDTAKYLRGDGTWATISSATYKNGATTRDASTASGSQTIAHGLGTTPKSIKLTGIYYGSTTLVYSFGSYNGTTNSSIYNTSSAATANSSTNAIVICDNGTGNRQDGVATFDATNITITWTKVGTPTANTIQILWEAVA